MFKYIIMAITIAIFTACSAPKPRHAPSWYTSKPKDFKYFYAVGSGNTVTHAKNKAIANMRNEIIEELDSSFSNKTSKIKVNDQELISQILKENEHLINTMSLADIKIDKKANFNNLELVLLKLPRKSVFEKFNMISNKRLKSSKENYALMGDKDPWIKKFSVLYNGMKDFPKLASIVQAKHITLSTSNNDEINYLNNLQDEYIDLKEQISIYVLPDINSRIYVKNVKDALLETGLELSSKPKSEKSLRLLITSTTENVQEYGFNRSKSLVKYSTYDLNKKRVAFRQHTFSAKSRKNYSDAKAQTAVHQKSKIKKLGIFDFIGVK
ncbi:LPP20 family lipoprotein [Sulfurimonas sp.]|uniref:LPP20 family lipoprotein n=1 Tax=Sulfurimonas sp. TaxID=2022749 RepID=UPI0035647827